VVRYVVKASSRLGVTSFGQKSDIARYEILFHFGGVYIDTDYQALRSLEPLHHCCDLYIGIQPLDTNKCELGIGIIGSRPSHPMLANAMRCLKLMCNKANRLVAQTGPTFYTNLFLMCASRLPTFDLVLPASYFYPCGYTQKNLPATVWQKPESFAAHMWEASWLMPGAFTNTNSNHV
jgi:mannosyltransferase OCH1-like enzyme